MRFSLTTLLCFVAISGAILGIYVRSKDELLLRLPCPSGKDNPFTFPRISEDGSLVYYTTQDNTVCVYDLSAAKVVRSVTVPGKGVTEISTDLSSDNAWLRIVYYQENGAGSWDRKSINLELSSNKQCPELPSSIIIEHFRDSTRSRDGRVFTRWIGQEYLIYRHATWGMIDTLLCILIGLIIAFRFTCWVIKNVRTWDKNPSGSD